MGLTHAISSIILVWSVLLQCASPYQQQKQNPEKQWKAMINTDTVSGAEEQLNAEWKRELLAEIVDNMNELYRENKLHLSKRGDEHSQMNETTIQLLKVQLQDLLWGRQLKACGLKLRNIIKVVCQSYRVLVGNLPPTQFASVLFDDPRQLRQHTMEEAKDLSVHERKSMPNVSFALFYLYIFCVFIQKYLKNNFPYINYLINFNKRI